MDPRDTFLTALQYSNTEILHHQGFIFLCGGKTDENNGKYVSARGHILNKISLSNPDLANHIELAEDIKDWWRSDRYTDLITFESDIAELSGQIVIFLESPGAIAELGSFSQIASIQRKLLIFVDEQHSNIDSFIQLGPVKYLEEHFDGSVYYFRWINHDNPFQILDQELIQDCDDEIIDIINSGFDTRNHAEGYDPAITRHQMLITADLIDIMFALTITEIIEYLKQFEITINKSRLKQYLFVLEYFDLIDIVKRGSSYFYVSNSLQIFAEYYSDKKIDRQRLKFDILNFYRNKRTEERRYRVIRNQLTKIAKGNG